jgi:hypothetical protein
MDLRCCRAERYAINDGAAIIALPLLEEAGCVMDWTTCMPPFGGLSADSTRASRWAV